MVSACCHSAPGQASDVPWARGRDTLMKPELHRQCWRPEGHESSWCAVFPLGECGQKEGRVREGVQNPNGRGKMSVPGGVTLSISHCNKDEGSTLYVLF
jgi:hypothetical protein